MVSSAAPTSPSACCPFGSCARPRFPPCRWAARPVDLFAGFSAPPSSAPLPPRVRTARVCFCVCCVLCFGPSCLYPATSTSGFCVSFCCARVPVQGHAHTLVGGRRAHGQAGVPSAMFRRPAAHGPPADVVLRGEGACDPWVAGGGAARGYCASQPAGVRFPLMGRAPATRSGAACARAVTVARGWWPHHPAWAVPPRLMVTRLRCPSECRLSTA